MSYVRHTETVVVDRREGDVVTLDNGWSWWLAEPLRPLVQAEQVAEVETVQFSRVVGWRDLSTDQWLWRLSDDDLAAQDQAFHDDLERKNRERLEANRDAWTAREAALPDWLRERLAVFHDQGGDRFRIDGWGYELVVAELAQAYDEACTAEGRDLPADTFGAFEDEPAAVREIADREGTSGNQHGAALALTRQHREGRSLAGTVSALSPITGDPYYARSAS